MKRSPHSGHSTQSKSMRRILSGVIRHPHFGQTALKDALTLSGLIFCFPGPRGIVSRSKRPESEKVRAQTRAQEAEQESYLRPIGAGSGELSDRIIMEGTANEVFRKPLLYPTELPGLTLIRFY
jgi:hypothetical protein